MATKMTQAKQRAQSLKKQMAQDFEAEITTNRHARYTSYLTKPYIVRDMKVKVLGQTHLSLEPKHISIWTKVLDFIETKLWTWAKISCSFVPHDDLLSITEYELQKQKIKTKVYVVTVTSDRTHQRSFMINSEELLTNNLKQFTDHIRSYNAQ